MPYDDSVTVRSHLKTLGIAALLATPGVTEFAINRPHEGWTETSEGWQRHDLPNASLEALNQFAPALAIYNKAKPPLSASEPEKPVRLPDGERGQIVIAPACEPGTVSLTIRVPSATRFSVNEWAQAGKFDRFRDVVREGTAARMTQDVIEAAASRVGTQGLDVSRATPVFNPARALGAGGLSRDQQDMLDALRQRDVVRFLTLAILNRLNIVLVGGTGSGKTTLMKALADLIPIIPREARIATIEDTHELPLPLHRNHVHLFYSEAIPARRIVKATLRMKFDRVLLAELRGDETWDYLTLLNTGHDGGLTTVHANDSIAALSRIATLVKQSPVGQTLPLDYLMREIRTTVDVVLFLENRELTEIYFDPVTKMQLLRGEA
ncbi:ATPase, T2SS/T4P/T4SS family [Robbsia andropogonis]|uniref:ATPase, T2SS/T4P/T4SS family n=1 Tax=Robbsia andropogonis TaxID=28092 RepID=UPI00209E19D2|nr:ATPase, T2SS/T4P/T4SS family [Robbsia andropogonis]MCP1121310.1 Flp pilus assembly complex ATPase component TadA [Robbsia andropogonis]MCP1131114.1 Flp pilus assembly complex ATPase component TadA [Robbsia andropogonis]